MLAALLLILTPAPHQAPLDIKTFSIIGRWQMKWGNSIQNNTIFDPDGLYQSDLSSSGDGSFIQRGRWWKQGEKFFFTEGDATYSLKINRVDGEIIHASGGGFSPCDVILQYLGTAR